MGGACAVDFGVVLDRLHEGDRIGPARDLAAGLRDNPRKRIGRGRLVEPHRPAPRAEGCEVAGQIRGSADVGKRFQRVTHAVVEFAGVEIERWPPLLRHDCVAERQRGMDYVRAADIERPGQRMRVGQDERVGARFGNLRLDACDLGGGFFAGKAQVVQDDAPKRGGRPVGPHRVDRVALKRHERGPRLGAGLGELFGTVRGVQPGVIAEPRPGRQVLLDPCIGRCLDQMGNGKQRRVGLVARLQRVAAIGKQHGAAGEYDHAAGRAGKAGQEGQPLFRRRDIFVLMGVGARKNQSVDAAGAQFAAQLCHAPRGSRTVFGVIERLKFCLEHAGALY